MSPRRNLLGHLRDQTQLRLAKTQRGLLNAQRAPVVAEQVFITKEEEKKLRKRRYQNYYSSGQVFVNDPVSSIPGLMLFDWDTGTPAFYTIVDGEIVAVPATGLPAEAGYGVYVHMVEAGGFYWATVSGDEDFNHDLYVSRDGGETWELSKAAASSAYSSFGIPVEGADGTIWLVTEVEVENSFPEGNSHDYTVWKSTDGGETWEEVYTYVGTVYSAPALGPQAIEVHGLAAHPTDPDVVAFAVSDRPGGDASVRIFYTTDGENFSNYLLTVTGEYNGTGAVHQLAFREDGTLVFVGEFDEGAEEVLAAYHTSDVSAGGGWTRHEIFASTSIGWGFDAVNGALVVDGDRAVASFGSSDGENQLFISEDGGETWSVLPTPVITGSISNLQYDAATETLYVAITDWDSGDAHVYSGPWGGSLSLLASYPYPIAHWFGMSISY